MDMVIASTRNTLTLCPAYLAVFLGPSFKLQINSIIFSNFYAFDSLFNLFRVTFPVQ